MRCGVGVREGRGVVGTGGVQHRRRRFENRQRVLPADKPTGTPPGGGRSAIPAMVAEMPSNGRHTVLGGTEERCFVGLMVQRALLAWDRGRAIEGTHV